MPHPFTGVSAAWKCFRPSDRLSASWAIGAQSCRGGLDQSGLHNRLVCRFNNLEDRLQVDVA